jgi:D-alanyl-D-alanine endopeptidase (penicillin-binding protein 7)
MFKKIVLTLLLGAAVASAVAFPLSSRHALVFDEESGEVLYEKNAHDVVAIASLTKLMTAMIIIDAKLDMTEMITIDESDVDTIKFSSSRVPVGSVLSRKELLELSLMSSDNRAAAALARTYPGGNAAFLLAVQEKLNALDMRDTSIEEPTGLSPNNRSTAADVVKMVTAASYYPQISRMSTSTDDRLDINGRLVNFRNTNRLIGQDGWDIQLSKTGFIREAGRCLAMRLQSGGKYVIVVLLNARATAARTQDAKNVHRFLNGQADFVADNGLRSAPRATKSKARKSRVIRVKTKGKRKAARKQS